LDGIQDTIERSGLRVLAQAHALAREGQRYFGLLECAPAAPKEPVALAQYPLVPLPLPRPRDYGLVIGLRNSHDQSFPAGLCVGSGVFVCDNLAFSGEITLARKHTTNILRDLPVLIESAVGRIADMRGRQDQRIATYKATEMRNGQVHDLLIQALDARIMGPTMLPDVLKQWREPAHPEFAERNAWSLFNAFTEALKDRSLFAVPKATQALHGLIDTYCGVLN